MTKHRSYQPGRNQGRTARLNLAYELPKDHVKAVAVMALVETLLLHMQEIWPDPRSSQHRSVKGMLGMLNQINRTIAGHVPDHMIELADRFLCKTQAAFDGFWDDMSEADRKEMADVKESWGIQPEQLDTTP